MSNWNNPTVNSTYVLLVDELKTRDLELAQGLDSAIVTVTPLTTGMKRWNSVNNYWEKYSGTAWVPLTTSYAISITGNAATATTATTAIASTNSIITDNTSNTVAYPTWVTSTSGNQPVRTTSSRLSFNPSTGVLTASGFNGAFTGNLTGTATVATTIASTLPVNKGGTGVATLTGVFYGNGTAAATVATAAQLVTAIGTSAVNQATNIAGGLANQIPYQSTTATTSFVSAPTIADTVLAWTGTAFTWVTRVNTAANGCIYENSQTISSTYTISTNKSAMSAGPITLGTGISITIPNGSRWVIL